MLLPLTEAILLGLCLYLFYRRFVFKSTLSNIPGPSGRSWWKGCFHQIFNENGWAFHAEILQKYGSVVRLPMLLGRDELYVCDPLALHHIVVKDQYIYEETSIFITTNQLVFGVSLLSTLGDHHRRQRKMLNPVFSLKHMRDLLPVLYPITYDLRNVLVQQVGQDGAREVDLLHWVSRAALDFIGQGGFGYSFNALHNDESSKYGAAVKKLGPLFFNTLIHRQVLPRLAQIGSPGFRRKVAELIPSEVMRESLETVDTLDAASRLIYQQKKRAHEEMDSSKVGAGKDILSVLMKANMEAKESDRLPEEEVIGQLNTFIFAGQETTSHAVSRILHLLSFNPEVQSRLRDEIVNARLERGGADFDYDTLMGLPYLDAVCRETLRVYPPVAMVNRTTKKDVVMPLAWPILSTDGKTEITEIPVPKNTNVIVAILGANRNRRIWGEDAEEWKPERWLKPLPDSVAKAHMPGVYASMMTFIGGGRACIGFKFAEMEMKLVLTTLLETIEFAPGSEVEWQMAGLSRPMLKSSASKTPQLPLKMSLLKVKGTA